LNEFLMLGSMGTECGITSLGHKCFLRGEMKLGVVFQLIGDVLNYLRPFADAHSFV
jgi:hypothetical protein